MKMLYNIVQASQPNHKEDDTVFEIKSIFFQVPDTLEEKLLSSGQSVITPGSFYSRRYPDIQYASKVHALLFEIKYGCPYMYHGHIWIAMSEEYMTTQCIWELANAIMEYIAGKKLSDRCVKDFAFKKRVPMTFNRLFCYNQELMSTWAAEYTSIVKWTPPKTVIKYQKTITETVCCFEDVPDGVKIIEVDGKEVIASCDICGTPITDEKEAVIAPDENGDTYTYCNLCLSPEHEALDSCCCGETDDSWKICPIHSKPVELD